MKFKLCVCTSICVRVCVFVLKYVCEYACMHACVCVSGLVSEDGVCTVIACKQVWV